MKSAAIDWVLGLIGAAIGAVAGYYVFVWGASYNLNAGVIPGALVGLGAGLLSGRQSRPRGIVCAVIALVVGTYTQWANFPFNADTSFLYFVTNFHKQVPLVLIMLGLGVYLGYRWGGDSLRPVAGIRRPQPGKGSEDSIDV
jgi:hypothetical protein